MASLGAAALAARVYDNQSQKAALQKLYTRCGGEEWTNKWSKDVALEKWDGVDMNADGRVTKLHLVKNNLVGSQIKYY